MSTWQDCRWFNNKFDSFEEIEFLKNITCQNRQEIKQKMDSSIANKNIDFVVKTHVTKKTPGKGGFIDKLYHVFGEQLKPMYVISF